MPLTFNPKTNTLEEELYRYQLQDRAEPNLYRDLFPYTEPPIVSFNHRLVPMNPPDRLYISDTTFRDGQQSMPPFSVKQIVDLFKLLSRLSGPDGVIRHSEFFLYTEKDRQAVEKVLELGLPYPQVTGYIRGRKEEFRLVREMGLKETGILCSASDYHIFLKLQTSRRKAIDMYLDTVRAALEEGVIPRCHLEDITRADFYGFIVPFVQELMELSRQAGLPVKVRACDTLGFGVTYPGVSLPRSVKGIVHGLVTYANVPPEQLEWHGHNDFYKVLINASTAWLYGCATANGTLLGIGERTGNTPIEALVFEYAGLRGGFDGMDPTAISEIARYFEEEIGHEIPPNQPFVGRNFNRTRAGIHADGLIKDEEIYNIFDTGTILGRPPVVDITDKSGSAGIAHWINARLHLESDKRLDKRHPGVSAIYDEIMKEYDAGRTTSVADEEMIALIRVHLPDLLEPDR
jgi:isopropylmalate/homocitrate/citramalate synthase